MLQYSLFDNRTPRRIVFRIATSATSLAENVLIRISDGRDVGWGSACVNSVTRETFDSFHRDLPDIVNAANRLPSLDPETILPALTRQFPHAPAAMNAFDMALYDLASRRENLPLSQYLARHFGGQARPSVPTDNTIFIEPLETTLHQAGQYVAQGFKVLKLKLGLDYQEERAKIAALRKLVGPDIAIYADANQGYTPAQAQEMSHLLAEHNYLFFEQPLPKDDLQGLGQLTRNSPLPIYADEAARSLDLVERICREKLADGVNIKLVKFGGIRQGIEALKLAQQHGRALMLGCYGELSLSLAAGMHFAAAFPLVKIVDLDSHFSLIDEPCQGLLMAPGGQLYTNGPGLGITVQTDRL